MVKITLFNHKGGVGKTTLTVNLARALTAMDLTVLLVDADPQCNLTSFYLNESALDELLDESNEEEGGNTIWSAVRPVVQNLGPVKEVDLIDLDDGLYLAPGDILLSDYEEELSGAWTEAFGRKVGGYSVTMALSDVVHKLAKSVDADVILFDVGPNVGALNRAILLDSDFFITPVAADLFSLRALSTVGRALTRWISDWKTIRHLCVDETWKRRLAKGTPTYLGYITSAFKVSSGASKAQPHARWEAKITPRVRSKIIEPLQKIDNKLVLGEPFVGKFKIGEVKHFHSLAPAAQEHGVAIGQLKGLVHAGHNPQVAEAHAEFSQLAKEIAKRVGL